MKYSFIAAAIAAPFMVLAAPMQPAPALPDAVANGFFGVLPVSMTTVTTTVTASASTTPVFAGGAPHAPEPLARRLTYYPDDGLPEGSPIHDAETEPEGYDGP